MHRFVVVLDVKHAEYGWTATVRQTLSARDSFTALANAGLVFGESIETKDITIQGAAISEFQS